MNRLFKLQTLILNIMFLLNHNNLFSITEKITEMQSNLVVFEDPNNVYIDEDVTIGTGTFIGAGAKITNAAIIGSNSTILSYAIIDGSTIGNDCIVKYGACVLQGSILSNGSSVGGLSVIINSTLGTNSVLSDRSTSINSSIGNSNTIKPFVYIENSSILNGITVNSFCSLVDSTINYGPIDAFETLHNITIDSNNNVTENS